MVPEGTPKLLVQSAPSPRRRLHREQRLLLQKCGGGPKLILGSECAGECPRASSPPRGDVPPSVHLTCLVPGRDCSRLVVPLLFAGVRCLRGSPDLAEDLGRCSSGTGTGQSVALPVSTPAPIRGRSSPSRGFTCNNRGGCCTPPGTSTCSTCRNSGHCCPVAPPEGRPGDSRGRCVATCSGTSGRTPP